MLRVVVADRFLVSRCAVLSALAMAPEVEVVGEALSAHEILGLVARTLAQALVMDAKMLFGQLPGLIDQIRAQAPVAVIVLAEPADPSQRELGRAALSAGAARVLPPMPDPAAAEFAPAAQRLIAAVVLAAREQAAGAGGAALAFPRVAGSPALHAIRRQPGRALIVALASSTGGPEALKGLLAALPHRFAVPILAVQHIAKGYVGALVETLSADCRLRVKLAQDGEPLVAGTLYMAPDDFHLGVADRHTIRLSSAPPVDGLRPSATWLFSSVARVFGTGAIAVILTGMGRDGIAGLREIRQMGGLIIAQDEESSAVYGMPREAVEAGLTHFVLPISMIMEQLVALT